MSGQWRHCGWTQATVINQTQQQQHTTSTNCLGHFSIHNSALQARPTGRHDVAWQLRTRWPFDLGRPNSVVNLWPRQMPKCSVPWQCHNHGNMCVNWHCGDWQSSSVYAISNYICYLSIVVVTTLTLKQPSPPVLFTPVWLLQLTAL